MQHKCSCGKLLNIPDSAAGKQVKCPSCGNVFVAPPEGGSAAAGSPPDKLIVTCSCGKQLSAPRSAAGKRIRCPQCGSIVQLPGGKSPAEQPQEEEPELSIEGYEPPPAAGLSASSQSMQPGETNDTFDVEQPKCPACGADLEAGSQFCVECGTHLTTGVRVDQPDLQKVAKEKRQEQTRKVGKIIMLAAIPLVVAAIVLVYFLVVGPWLQQREAQRNQALRRQRGGEEGAPAGVNRRDEESEGAPRVNRTDEESEGGAVNRRDRESEADAASHGDRENEEPPQPVADREPKPVQPPKKTGDEGYLEITAYAPGRTRYKMAIINARRMAQLFQAMEGRWPESVKELRDYPDFSESEREQLDLPEGLEWEYNGDKGEFDIVRTKDKATQ